MKQSISSSIHFYVCSLSCFYIYTCTSRSSRDLITAWYCSNKYNFMCFKITLIWDGPKLSRKSVHKFYLERPNMFQKPVCHFGVGAQFFERRISYPPKKKKLLFKNKICQSVPKWEQILQQIATFVSNRALLGLGGRNFKFVPKKGAFRNEFSFVP